MTSSDVASKPRYSVNAISERAFHQRRGVRLDFHDNEILIYVLKPGFLRDNRYSFLRRSEYSDVKVCRYIDSRVQSWSTLGGFAWGPVHARINISLMRVHSSTARQKDVHFWNIENINFGAGETSEIEFRSMYSWLCGKIKAEGGTV